MDLFLVMMPQKEPSETTFSEEESDSRFAQTLRGALATPPVHRKSGAPSDKNKPAKASA